MKRSILLAVFVALMAMPFVYCAEAWADCGSDCSGQCDHLGSGPAWAACMENCLKGCLKNDPPDVPPVPEPIPVDQYGSVGSQTKQVALERDCQDLRDEEQRLQASLLSLQKSMDMRKKLLATPAQGRLRPEARLRLEREYGRWEYDREGKQHELLTLQQAIEKKCRVMPDEQTIYLSASSKKGRDGAACSGDDECAGVCRGGSCCTPQGAACNEYSHCCGYQSCVNGKCPE
jgi:hypothetical protein